MYLIFLQKMDQTDYLRIHMQGDVYSHMKSNVEILSL